jgi:hypothetical protein
VRLAILFAVAAVVLLIVRQRFVPASFGEEGHYRADVIPLIASQPIVFAGLQACADCHPDVVEVKATSYHRGLTCEGCHGAAADHVDDPTEVFPLVPTERGACLRCHSYLPSRPTGFPQIIESTHNPMEPCAGCHDPHEPTPPEVPESCTACHAAIARTKAVSHHRSLDCDTCHTAEPAHRENPRSALPRKPTTRDFCGQCHAPEATSASTIPRVEMSAHGGRYLCWQCHYPHYPEGN